MDAKRILYILLVYCFTSTLFIRELSLNFPSGTLIEGFLVITLLAAIFQATKTGWVNMPSDLF